MRAEIPDDGAEAAAARRLGPVDCVDRAMIDDSAVAIVLAAGLGTRMRSERPKVLHEVAGLPMLGHVLRAADGAGLANRIVVTGPDGDAVRSAVDGANGSTRFVVQEERRGTGHAVMTARPALGNHAGSVFVLFGDTPLIRPETITAMDEGLSGADIVVLSFTPDDPAGYGRIVTNGSGELVAIREHADASDEELGIGNCFSGLMAMRSADSLELLDEIEADNAKGELYLTDLVEIARGHGLKAGWVEADPVDVLGVNSRAELAAAEAHMQDRLRRRALEAGATLIAPETVFLSHDTVLERDVVVEPHVVFAPGVTVREGAIIHSHSYIQSSEIGPGAELGPFARLRPGAQILRGARIGNFVEIKNAVIGEGTKASHLSYIGDTTVGPGANIGAGTIVCNYDGFEKYRTEIGAGAFIGSNSALVAPVSVGEGAYVATGTVVTRDVEADAMAIARPRQENKPGWAQKFRELRERMRSAAGAKDKE